jgi:hypothetical protein
LKLTQSSVQSFLIRCTASFNLSNFSELEG